MMMLSKRVGQKGKDEKWQEFTEACKILGFEVRVTGGNFLTHEIDCGEGEFNTILEIVAWA